MISRGDLLPVVHFCIQKSTTLVRKLPCTWVDSKPNPQFDLLRANYFNRWTNILKFSRLHISVLPCRAHHHPSTPLHRRRRRRHSRSIKLINNLRSLVTALESY